MPQKIDLSGRVIGKWTVIAQTAQRSAAGSVMWLCVCECGTQKTVSSHSLNQGKSMSCARCARLQRNNTYKNLGNGTTQVICSDDRCFFIDTNDVQKINPYQWWIDKKGYVKAKYLGRTLSLSRFLLDIMETKPGLFVDHVSGNTRDNRRSNLRLCMPSENIKNRKLNANNRTGYKGVSFHSRLNKFRADIRSGAGKTIYLGCYHTALEAAAAYDRAALLLHGDFARTNHDLGLMEGVDANRQAV
jgi:hypothetical protein